MEDDKISNRSHATNQAIKKLSPQSTYSQIKTSDDTFIQQDENYNERINYETILLLNKYLDHLNKENYEIKNSLNYKKSNKYELKQILEENKKIINRIKKNLDEICIHDWEDDHYDTLDGLVKYTYCKICDRIKK